MIEHAALNTGTRVFGCRYCAPVSEVAPKTYSVCRAVTKDVHEAHMKRIRNLLLLTL